MFLSNFSQLLKYILQSQFSSKTTKHYLTRPVEYTLFFGNNKTANLFTYTLEKTNGKSLISERALVYIILNVFRKKKIFTESLNEISIKK